METVREILSDHVAYDRIVLLQGKDYPLRSPRQIHEFFNARPNDEFCKAHDISISKKPNDYMKCCGYWDKDRKKNLFIQFCTFLNVVVKVKYRSATVRMNGDRWHVYHGWAQFALTAKCAAYILSIYDTNPTYNKYMKHRFPPDELYIPTIIHNSFFAKHLSDYSVVARKGAEWTSDHFNLTYFEYPVVVNVFDSENQYNDLLDTGALFIRKVTLPGSEKLLAKIDNSIRENEYGNKT